MKRGPLWHFSTPAAAPALFWTHFPADSVTESNEFPNGPLPSEAIVPNAASTPESEAENPPESTDFTLSRRQTLKLLSGGAIAAGLGYSRFKKPEPTVYQPDRLALPQTLTTPKTVAIVGGGLAGLAAAYELSQRGFRVTLLEKGPQFGGKIASWPINVNGETLWMEHGFHGFFPQYYNLWSLAEEVNARQDFVSLERYSVLYRGDRYAPEVFYPSRSSFPWNIVDLTFASENRFKWGLNLASPGHWGVFHAITSFHPQKTYAQLDNLSMVEWAQAGDFPKGLYDLYFLPFGKSTLNSPDVLSAGELMQFFHFYFFGNPEGLAFNGSKQDMGRTLVDPIAQAIAANGGQLITRAQVDRVEWSGDRVTALSYRETGSASPTPFWVDRHAALAPSEDGIAYFGGGDETYAVSGDRALSLTCPHQGCSVVPQADGSYRCPCHGACFDRAGKVTQGPATADLAAYRVEDQAAAGDRVRLAPLVADAAPALQTLTADYFVFAADVRGIRHLFDLAEGDVPPALHQQVSELVVADPFAVARLWFDRDFEWDQSEFTSVSGYRLTDSITRYHKIQEDYQRWHERTGGSVVELHAYCYKEAEFPTQEALLTTFEAELYELVPALREANCLHRELVNQKNFSGFPPGSYPNRPESRAAGAANLMFAGDWVKMPFPCGLMERAVSSGFLAANEVCAIEGLQRRPLLTVKPEGLLQI